MPEQNDGIGLSEGNPARSMFIEQLSLIVAIMALAINFAAPCTSKNQFRGFYY
jgi:hypothetical protein